MLQFCNFHYKNLSAGEKSAFDLLLDLLIKSAYFDNTVYCIDEPETHMHTALQSKLLSEMYNLIPNNSQLWLSTHSIGMLNAAKELEETFPNTVCFLNFTDIDFDASVIIRPSTIDATIWNKFLELAFGDFIDYHGFKNVKNAFLFPTYDDNLENKGRVKLDILSDQDCGDIGVIMIPAGKLNKMYLNNNNKFFGIKDLIDIL